MVFYRKYRPQKIADLDNEHVRETLFGVLSGEFNQHAFLFTGPKGLGKTSAARILAKAVNCEKKSKDAEPCNECDMCKSITNGSNMDVLEIDAASNRGIDEIRDLREKIRLSPVSARKKVYIIDEVHMLTTEAFNALLKTLEEPPAHGLFILCTTESHKVPATILSRCLHLAFTKATKEELVRSFSRIALGEKLDVNEEALEAIAMFADGSFRDGTKAFEEIVALASGKKITKELIEQKFQISNIQFQVTNMLGVFAHKDIKKGLVIVEEVCRQGIDMKYFTQQLVSALHGLLLNQIEGGKDSALSLQDIKTLVELLAKANAELKYAVLAQLPLELAIVEWGGGQRPSPPASEADRGGNDIVKGNTFWQEFIEKVKLKNHSIAGVLRGCSLSRYDTRELVIEAKYKFHKEKLEEKKAKEVLEKVVKEISGQNITVSIVLQEK